MQGQHRFSVVIFLVVILSILHSSKALKCYGTADDGSGVEMECPPDYPLCITFSADFVGKDIRGCGIENFCDINKDVVTECYECKTDLCNTL